MSLDPEKFPNGPDVTNPPHYTSHKSGVECIDITEHMSFNLGNVVKYVWRAGLKGDPLEDLQKAKWYIEREIKRTRTIVHKCPVVVGREEPDD